MGCSDAQTVAEAACLSSHPPSRRGTLRPEQQTPLAGLEDIFEASNASAYQAHLTLASRQPLLETQNLTERRNRVDPDSKKIVPTRRHGSKYAAIAGAPQE